MLKGHGATVTIQHHQGLMETRMKAERICSLMRTSMSIDPCACTRQFVLLVPMSCCVVMLCMSHLSIIYSSKSSLFSRFCFADLLRKSIICGADEHQAWARTGLNRSVAQDPQTGLRDKGILAYIGWKYKYDSTS